MAVFGIKFKSNQFCFPTDLQFIQSLVILFGLFNLSVCLFEDQIGKFDWRQNYVGQLKFAHFDTISTAKKIIVVTEENVVAALNLKSGHVIWRQVLERGPKGEVQFLHVDSEVVTVSGNSPYLIRGWDLSTGKLLWEWSLTMAARESWEEIDYVRWVVSEGRLQQAVVIRNNNGPIETHHIEVSSYDVYTGANNGKTTKISPRAWSESKRCIMAGTYFACPPTKPEDTKIYWLDIGPHADYGEEVTHEYNFSSLLPHIPVITNISAVQSSSPIIALETPTRKTLILLKSDEAKQFQGSVPVENDLQLIQSDEEKLLIKSAFSHETRTFTVQGLWFKNALSMINDSLEDMWGFGSSLDFRLQLPETLGTPKLRGGFCTTKANKPPACRILISTEDGAIALMQNSQPAKLLWTREESLTNIVAVDLLDLPVSELEASIEREFDNKERDIIGMFTRRVSSQVGQIQSLLFNVMGVKSSKSEQQKLQLIRDKFGLHKMIVVATAAGKVFGIDNLSGEILWQKRLVGVAPFGVNGKEKMLLMVQRTTRYYPHPGQSILVGKDNVTGNGVLFVFNPITGESLSDGLIRLDFQIKQVLLLQQTTSDYLRVLVLLDNNDKVHVFPENAKAILLQVAKETFLYTVDSHTNVLTGYTFAYSTVDNIVAHPHWQLNLGLNGQRIIEVANKNPIERVHSQGRVLPDRSVLYKYINPNLVAVVTQGPDPVHRTILNVYLIDVVSGLIVFSASHKRVREPINIVHSENWLAYSYFNDKFRRNEISSVELYEGKIQSNATAFSSLTPPQLPLVERQSYIFPAAVNGMQVTITEKGITNKNILMLLNNGGVLEMPWMFLDPRRPLSATQEMREEGVIPYIPELPIPSEAIINYNRSLARIRDIHTSLSGLESTSLVFIYGLDLFYTRVAPSKTFDILKEDFDYYLIVIVLSALLISSWVTKRLASRKALRQAWK